MFHEISRPFNMTYRCFSVSMLPGNERQDVERGGKSKNSPLYYTLKSTGNDTYTDIPLFLKTCLILSVLVKYFWIQVYTHTLTARSSQSSCISSCNLLNVKNVIVYFHASFEHCLFQLSCLLQHWNSWQD